jgi:hypothetical protein
MPIKKKLNKPKVTIAKKKKVLKRNKKVMKPIVIITQKLPREKCCTDVTKSGEAYTIPVGFTQRLGAILPLTKNVSTSTQADIIPFIKEENHLAKPEATLLKPISLPYYEEEQQPTTEEQIQEISQTEGSLRQKRKYEKKKQGPRRNSIADLEQRYTAVTGYIYVGPTLKVKDFQQLVENLEKKNNL